MACLWTASAQTDIHLQQAERFYNFLTTNQPDSAYALTNATIQQTVSQEAFRAILPQMEAQFGKVQSHTEWQALSGGGYTVYVSDLSFERYKLRMQLAFDKDGRVSGFYFVPVPAPTTAVPWKHDPQRMEEREVTVGAEGFKLPATLTLPRQQITAGRKVPCVILVHGSGPNDRDETLGPNKPFRDIAYALALQGIASLRYDKRTKVYGSAYIPQGQLATYDTETVDDAVAISAQVQSFAGIHADSIYLLGHSLGGLLAPRIAEKAPTLAGIVILAGPARTMPVLLKEQTRYLASLVPQTEQQKQAGQQLEQQLSTVEAWLEKRQRQGKAHLTDIRPQDPELTQTPVPGIPYSYWLFDAAYHPVETASALSLPILILQGERDYQVTMQDFGLWRAGLMRHKNVSFKSYPKLNHLLQEGTGQSNPTEYNHPSPVPAYVIHDIAAFIRKGRL